MRFKIKNDRKLITKNAPIKIDFFVKFNELFIVPDLKELYVNGKSYCFKRPDDEDETSTKITKITTPSTEDFKLTDLNFNEFPAIQTIPTSFYNVRLLIFPCVIFCNFLIKFIRIMWLVANREEFLVCGFQMDVKVMMDNILG